MCPQMTPKQILLIYCGSTLYSPKSNLPLITTGCIQKIAQFSNELNTKTACHQVRLILSQDSS
jgi:hypothetical protein